ncbi:MAG: leucine-rich repeat domain-containing protein [Alphaproteobacteria bacterium]|nr:leucine-rich repeat domain-containing protein [Alphaproteobacteria bacterium]
MKRLTLILILMVIITASEASAVINCYDNFDPSAGCLSKTNDSGTVYYTISEGKMTIYGPEQKDENGNYTASAQIPDNAFCNVLDKWIKETTIPEVKEVEMKGNITSIGDSAFWNSHISNINIADTVTEIKANAFCSAKLLNTITIPDSVISIGYDIFDGEHGENPTIVIQGDNVSFEGRLSSKKYASNLTLYCKQGVEACEGKAGDVRYYVLTDGGLYQDVADNKYFATAEFMARGAACSSERNCMDILTAIRHGMPFDVGLKTYNSFADFMSGRYIPKRIYTVEEAEKVSKKTGNTFKLRYK